MYPFCFGDCSEGRRDLPGEHMCGRGRGSAGLRGSANTNIQEQGLQLKFAIKCKPWYNGLGRRNAVNGEGGANNV